jgi:hypothetical protein
MNERNKKIYMGMWRRVDLDPNRRKMKNGDRVTG